MGKIEKTNQYEIGQYVVYPLQGVGVVKNIEEKTLGDKTLNYYIIYIKVSDMTIMIPIDKAQELGLRSIVDKKAATLAIENIAKIKENVPVDWKQRYQMNIDFLKDGSIEAIAKVVKILYTRSKIKELPVQERKLYDNALRLLIDESSLSIEKDRDEIEALIFSKLEKK